MISSSNRHFYTWQKLRLVLMVSAIAYTSICLLLFFGQRYSIYRPKAELSMLPSKAALVPPEMSQRLYEAAPAPRQLVLISGAEHVRLYQPGAQSYLKAIQRFVRPLQQSGAR